MKKRISLLILIAMALTLCACGQEQPAETTAGTTAAVTTAPAETTEAVDLEREQRSLFYDYLKSDVIPGIGLADMRELTWKISAMWGVPNDPQHLLDQGRGGLLSAVVRDFDLDGTQDMVTFHMEAATYEDTWKGIYDGDNTVYRVSMHFYTLENGTVTFQDSYPCLIMLDGTSWGNISIRMELMEKGIYISAHSYAEDYSTYGASPTTVFHAEEGKFVFDYIGGIHYGQSSIDENPNHILGTTNMNLQDYTIRSIDKSAADTDPNGDPEENRWIYRGVFENLDWSEGTMRYTGTDYTGLRIILEKGVDAFPHDPLPQGGIIPEHPSVQLAKDAAQVIADYVKQKAACEYVNITANYSEYSNTTTVRIETEEYTFLGLVYDADTMLLKSVGVSSNDYPVPQEWFDMKDALLSYEPFGLLSGETAQFTGRKINYNKHMNGTPITGATVTIMQVTDTYFSLKFAE